LLPSADGGNETKFKRQFEKLILPYCRRRGVKSKWGQKDPQGEKVRQEIAASSAQWQGHRKGETLSYGFMPADEEALSARQENFAASFRIRSARLNGSGIQAAK